MDSSEDITVENSLPEDLRGFRLGDEFADVKLKVGEQVFAAHKEILKASSPMFKSMFSDNWPKEEVYELDEQFLYGDVMEDFIEMISPTIQNQYSHRPTVS